MCKYIYMCVCVRICMYVCIHTHIQYILYVCTRTHMKTIQYFSKNTCLILFEKFLFFPVETFMVHPPALFTRFSEQPSILIPWIMSAWPSIPQGEGVHAGRREGVHPPEIRQRRGDGVQLHVAHLPPEDADQQREWAWGGRCGGG